MKEEYYRVIKKWLLPIVFLICAVGIVVMSFYIKVSVERKNSNKASMLFVAESYANSMYEDLKILKAAAQMTSDLLSDENILNRDIVKEVISLLKEHTPAYEVIYNQGEGVGITSDGAEVILSDCSYFEQIKSVGQVKYIFTNDELGGQDAVVIAIPVGKYATQNLLLYYSIEEMKSNMNISSEFNKNAFSALINIKGDYLIKASGNTNFFADDNLWDIIRNEENKTNVAGAQTTIKQGNAGILKGEVLGEARTIVYYPIEMSDWVFVIGIDQKYVDQRENGEWEDARAMLLELFAIAVVFIFAVGVIDIFSKKRDEEKNKLLVEKADTDLLTRLNNKLATETKIKEYMQKNPDALGMMFIVDIDDFKKINDTRGHAFGDEVLRSFGEKISSVFRATDIIGRTGGDEFIIFLKYLQDDANTIEEAKKLDRFFEEFIVGDYVKYSVSASIGTAVFPEHGADFESLYKAADKALYKAKKRGKNQVAFYDDRDREL